jgi:hypothetical protein
MIEVEKEQTVEVKSNIPTSEGKIAVTYKVLIPEGMTAEEVKRAIEGSFDKVVEHSDIDDAVAGAFAGLSEEKIDPSTEENKFHAWGVELFRLFREHREAEQKYYNRKIGSSGNKKFKKLVEARKALVRYIHNSSNRFVVRYIHNGK